MFRFSIRDLLLVMVLTGMACAWWIDHKILASEAHDARRRAEEVLDDAQSLAWLHKGREFGLCSQQSMELMVLLKKYAVARINEPQEP
jgi:hypothetical protein